MNEYAAFPLDIVLLPEEQQALHLFEERYLELYKHHNSGEPFVIVYHNANNDFKFGSLVVIDQTAETYPDGTIDIIVKGIAAFVIKKFMRQGNNVLYPVVNGQEVLNVATVNNYLHKAFNDYLSRMCKKPAIDKNINIYQIAQRLHLSPLQKKELMMLSSSNEINLYLLNYIKMTNCCLEQEEKLNQKFHLN